MISEQFAKDLAISLMDKHDLSNWNFAFDRAKTSLGQTNYKTRTITLSRPFLAHVDESQLRDTILHEIAHALAGNTAGHGGVWKQYCRKIGTDPSRTTDTETAPPGAWIAVCPNGHTQDLHRAPSRVRSCNRCAPGFKVENIYNWYKNGILVPVENMPVKYQTEYNRIMARELV